MKLISRFLNFGSSPRVKNDQITQLQSTVTEKSTENEQLRLKLEQLDKQAKDLQVFYGLRKAHQNTVLTNFDMGGQTSPPFSK